MTVSLLNKNGDFFFQLYTIHSKYKGSFFPMVFILLTKRTAKLYAEVLETLKRICAEETGVSTK